MGTKTFMVFWLLKGLSIQSNFWLQEQILLLDYKVTGPLFQFMPYNCKDLDLSKVEAKHLCKFANLNTITITKLLYLIYDQNQ